MAKHKLNSIELITKASDLTEEFKKKYNPIDAHCILKFAAMFMETIMIDSLHKHRKEVKK